MFLFYSLCALGAIAIIFLLWLTYFLAKNAGATLWAGEHSIAALPLFGVFAILMGLANAQEMRFEKGKTPEDAALTLVTKDRGVYAAPRGSFLCANGKVEKRRGTETYARVADEEIGKICDAAAALIADAQEREADVRSVEFSRTCWADEDGIVRPRSGRSLAEFSAVCGGRPGAAAPRVVSY